MWVGNAKQAASFYTVRFGFRPVAYRGLETGERSVCSHVLQQGGIFLVLQSHLNPADTSDAVASSMAQHIGRHGDSVRDIAFTVDDAVALYDAAVSRGATSVRPPWTEEDSEGRVVMASIATVSCFTSAINPGRLSNCLPRADGYSSMTAQRTSLLNISKKGLCVNNPKP